MGGGFGILQAALGHGGPRPLTGSGQPGAMLGGMFANRMTSPQAGSMLPSHGALGSFMQRPPSSTNLPRTMGQNLMERFTARPTSTFTGGSGGAGPAMPAQYSAWDNPGGFAPSSTPPPWATSNPSAPTPLPGGGFQGGGWTTMPAQPNLTRFVPFTGAGGQSLLGGGAPQGGGWFGGFSPSALTGVMQGSGQPGQYRTPLAALFPAYQGNGPMMSATRDYFQGPVQPSFEQQFGYLR